MNDLLSRLRDAKAADRFEAGLRLACGWSAWDAASRLFQQGALALKRQDAWSAVRLFRELGSLQPDFPLLAEALATALRRDADYEACLQVEGRSRQIRFEHGHACLALGLGPQAEQCFAAILEQDPDHAASWVGLHAARLEQAGLEAACACLHRALACRGANGRYWSLLAVYRLWQGDASLLAGQIDPYPARQALVRGVQALWPYRAAVCRLFSLSASTLRFAMQQARQSGLVLEFGVRRGTSLRVLAAATGQPVHGFDSFEGLPEDWSNRPAGLLTTGAQLPDVPPHVTLHAGWFEDTLPDFLARQDGPVRLVNIDSDLYQSARYVLEQLTPRMQVGTVIVFDEMIGNRNWQQDEYRAWTEWVGLTGWTWQVLALSPATKQVVIQLYRPANELTLRASSC